MIESVPLSWLFAGMGLWFLLQGVRPRSGAAAPGLSSRVSPLSHAVMAAVMSAMLWPRG